MKFFTAGHVLSQSEPTDPANPVTVNSGDSVQFALERMLENDYTQLPVEDDGVVVGAISYRSISRTLKTVQGVDIRQQEIGAAMEDPQFVDTDRDVYKILETLAVDDYIFIGAPDDLEGILTRYDILLFIREVVEPFLLIGEIEESLRNLFRLKYEDIGQKIEQSFEPRAENDDKFNIPNTVQDFNYKHYIEFVDKNWNELDGNFNGEKEFIIGLLKDVQDIRHDLFHFRSDAKSIDRDLLDIAHTQLTAPSQK